MSLTFLILCFAALDARLEVGLEQQAELMLKMMATLQADSILQSLTSSSSTGKYTTARTAEKGRVCSLPSAHQPGDRSLYMYVSWL